jgi:UDP-2,4-diacetamido-2,4,6-trideoxy-beta-L-altropyranose hydrolase
MRSVVFRVDGNKKIGLGHVVRCIALAEMLGNDFKITFVMQQPDETILNQVREVASRVFILPEETDYKKDFLNFSSVLNSPDFVVLDGYNFKEEYQKDLKPFTGKTLLVDDLGDHHIYADIVINHSCGIENKDYNKEAHTQLFLGNQYALLRKEFLQYAQKPPVEKHNGVVLIGMGGADPNNITRNVLELCKDVKEVKSLIILVGAAYTQLNTIQEIIHKNPDLNIRIHQNLPSIEVAELIEESEVVICPSSSFSMEVCAVKCGLITGYTFDNQKKLYEGITSSGCGYAIGDINELNASAISSALKEVLSVKGFSQAQLRAQQKFIDGLSGERIRAIFNNN